MINKRTQLGYYWNCPEYRCRENFKGVTARRILASIIDHKHRDKNFYTLKHGQYNSGLWYIRSKKQKLNAKETLMKLNLFNIAIFDTFSLYLNLWSKYYLIVHMISNDCFFPPELITCSNSVLQYCTDIHQYVSAFLLSLSK